VTRVVNFELEAAFVSEPFTAPASRRACLRGRLVLCDIQGYRQVSGPADLGRSTLIAFAQGCSYRKRTGEWLGSSECDARTDHGICLRTRR